MVLIRPFRGLRFQVADDKDWPSIVCPPYDVIAPSQQEHLYRDYATNIVRLELPKEEDGLSRYQAAARTLHQWRQQGILVQEQSPSFYLYCQEYSPPNGSSLVRRGFFAALQMEEPRKGSVLAHEKTLPKPKEDRLHLLKALHTNISPIFGLFSDAKKQAQKVFAQKMQQPPQSDFVDADGIRHKFWIIDDSRSQRALTRALKTKKVFIADGHHRYETAWTYKKLMSPRKSDAALGVNHCLVYLCPLEDPGLVVLPTHRVLEAGLGVSWQAISRNFNILMMPNRYALLAEMKKHQKRHAFGLIKRDVLCLLTLKSKPALDKKLAKKPLVYRRLDTVILHTLLLNQVDTNRIRFVKDAGEAQRLVQSGQGNEAYLLNAPPVEQMKAVSLAGEVMPQKSTYFTPKLATGLVLMPLEGSLC